MNTASPSACPQRSISSARPAAAIIRQALEDYLTRQPDPRISAVEAATTLAAMAASIAELQEQMQEMRARLDMLAADRRPAAARTRQPAAADRAADADAAYARMQALQPQGLSLAQIAAQLTAEGLRTRHGKPWHKSTVAYVLKTHGR